METSQTWMANVEIVNAQLAKESWYNTFWAKFSGNVDLSNDENGNTVYRPSGIVEIIQEISENVEQNRLNSIAVNFSELQRSNKESVLSMELAVCWAMASQIEEPQPEIEPLEPETNLEDLPDANIW